MNKKTDSNGLFLATNLREYGSASFAEVKNRPDSTLVQFPWLFVVLILIIAGCSTTQNYAPVRPYQRDLVDSAKYYIVKQGDTLYYLSESTKSR